MKNILTIPHENFDLVHPLEARAVLDGYAALANYYSRDGYDTRHEDILAAVGGDRTAVGISIASIIRNGRLCPDIAMHKLRFRAGLSASFFTNGLVEINYRGRLQLPQLDILKGLVMTGPLPGCDIFFADENVSAATGATSRSQFLRTSSRLVSHFLQLTSSRLET